MSLGLLKVLHQGQQIRARVHAIEVKEYDILHYSYDDVHVDYVILMNSPRDTARHCFDDPLDIERML